MDKDELRKFVNKIFAKKGLPPVKKFASEFADGILFQQLFIQQLAGSCKTRAIVEGVLHTASKAGMTSVAEGIEDLETHAWLSSLGCDRGQGYFIAKPMLVSQFTSLIELNRYVTPRPDYG